MTPWWGSTTSGANRCPITGRGAVIEHLRAYHVARPEKSSISLIRCGMNHEMEVFIYIYILWFIVGGSKQVVPWPQVSGDAGV